MNSLAQKIYTLEGVTKENIIPDGRILHIGCGKNKLKGSVGMDILALPGVDIVHNLDSTPWPIEAASIDLIFAHSVVEHVTDIVAFFSESARVLKKGGRIVLTVPYFRSVDSFTDPTHKHFFTSSSLDYFMDSGNSLANYEYSQVRFKCVGFWYGWPQKSRNPIVRAFKSFIYAHRRLYDQYVSLLVPAKVLMWELELY